jgi:hypothetical protein
MVPTTAVRFGRTKLVTFSLNGSRKQPSHEFIGEVILKINVTLSKSIKSELKLMHVN